MDNRLRSVINKLKSQKAFTFVAFGDSYTFGSCCDGWISKFGVNGSSSGSPDLAWNSFANLFYRHIKKINQNITYYNQGNPGYQASDALGVVAAQVIARNPNLVTMEFGINDCNAGVSISTFKTNYQSLITQILNTGATLILLIPSPYAQSSNKYGWIGTPLSDSPLPFSNYVDAVIQMAKDNNLVCADAYHMFINQYYRGFPARYWLQDYTGSNSLMGEHPSELGHLMHFNVLKQTLGVTTI